MKYAPVIIPTLNRVTHLKRCVESLKRNPGSEKTDLHISVDYPPNEKYVDGYENVKNYVKTIDGFNKVKIYTQDHNLGPAGNWVFLKNIIFDGYETFIESEDDNEFSPNFLSYINKGLELFKDDRSVSALCASNDDLIHNRYRSSYFKLTWHNARGVGTWVDSEKRITQNIVEDLMKTIYNDPSYQKKIREYNGILYQAVSLFLTDEIPVMKDKMGKAIPIDYTRSLYNILNDTYCICPIITQSRNWGYDGSGANSEKDDNYDPRDVVIDDRTDFEFIKEEDQKAADEEAFNNQHSRYTVSALPYIRSRLIMFLHNNLNEKMFNKISNRLINSGKNK